MNTSVSATEPVIALFRSHYSLGNPGLLTLEEPGKSKPGNPRSVFDLSSEVKLSHVCLVDSRVDGFLQAYKSATKCGTTLCYGLKMVVCPDMLDKTPETRRAESNVIVFITGGSQGYNDLLRIHNRAWGVDGQFEHRGIRYGRVDWKLLKTFWTERLSLALPWHSSFIARNTLTFSSITPDLPVQPWLFKEIASELPFAGLIDTAIDRYIGEDAKLRARIIPTKTVAYEDSAAFRAYVVMRAIYEKSSFDAPNIDHLASDKFSWESFKRLNNLKPL